MAFDRGSRQVDDVIVDIGKGIVKKCANVPLSIRIIGSMLYDQDKSKWVLFQKLNLAEMGQCEDGIMPILKFSYYHLTPQLKSCFSYCALFPKDCVIKKSLLINLWLAQGCLECPSDMWNIEDVAEEYFSILLHKCFFQDIQLDELGEIYSIQLHDLIHDLAQEVAGQESCLVIDSSTSRFSEKIRHVSIAVQDPLSPCLSDNLGNLKAMRTFLRPFSYEVSWESDAALILANCGRVRVLDLHMLRIESLCNTMINLPHLRYLDLSFSYLKKLPKSISNLHNLQVLKLNNCRQLEELPADLRELVNIRHLDIIECDALTHMPARMGSLIGLSTLTMFVVGGGSSNQERIGQLRDLIPLINLRGELRIKFTKGYLYDTTNLEEGSYLLNKKFIMALKLEEEIKYDYELSCYHKPLIVDERLLKHLEPHRDLKKIEIQGYKGIKLPGWAITLATSFPHLVIIHLRHFSELERLPRLSQLHHLKILTLVDMLNVEYMEEDSSDILPFFPSLKELRLSGFPKLKGWWREVGVKREVVIPAFSGVHKLEIEMCPNLISFPGCPGLKKLKLSKFNEALAFSRKREQASLTQTAPSSSEIACDKSNDLVYHLDTLNIDNVGLLNSIFGESLQGIRELIVDRFEVESLSTSANRYLKYASSIKSLCLFYCENLKSVSGGGIEHMNNLQSLMFQGCDNLDLEEGMPWEACYRLSLLLLDVLPKLTHLPKGMQYLSSLLSLYIYRCWNFEALPEWLHCLASLRSFTICGCPKLQFLPEAIGQLPSLQRLTISCCDGLKKRCREPDGEDWPKIQHVPVLDLMDV